MPRVRMRVMKKKPDPRSTKKFQDGMSEKLIDDIRKGWTDRGLKRLFLEQEIFQHYDDTRLQSIIDEARAKCRIPDPEPDGLGAPIAEKILATPYHWTMPEKIPMRDWLYGKLLIRCFLSMTIAGGGIGKSSLIVAEVLAMVSGKDLLGVSPPRKLKVWLWNLEDPQVETTRKIQATAMHYKLNGNDITKRLFVNSGRDTPLVIAKTLREGVVICHPVVDDLVQEIKEKEIDVLIVDPFVSCHEVAENDNSAIDMVAKEWSRVAEIANCAVHLVHHTRKAPTGSEVTTESGRGAKALSDACRVARAINQMTEEEAKKSGIENPRLHFRTFNDKANLAPPSAKSDWFKLTSVYLYNGPNGMEGDDVGVVTKWELPNLLDGVTGEDFEKVAAVIRSGRWRKDAQAAQWAGKAVAQALKLNLDNKRDRTKVKTLLEFWLGTGALVEIKGDDAKRNERTFIEAAAET